MFANFKPNVHVLFFVLFSFSVLSPVVEGFNYVNVLMVCLTLMGIVVTAILVLWQQKLFGYIIKEYGVEIALILTYALVSTGTMLSHIEVFDGSWYLLLFYGLSPIVIWSSMPLIWLIFRFGTVGKERYCWLFGWSVFVLLALVGIWQAFDYPATQSVLKYFVANDRFDLNAPNITSLTRISSDFGVIMAMALFCCVLSLSNPSSENKRYIYFAMALVFVIAGILSGSRNFVLTSCFGILILAITNFRSNLKGLLLVGLLFFVLINIIALTNNSVLERLSPIFPYLAKIKASEAIAWTDLLFIFQDQALYTSGRGYIWKHVLVSWLENFWFGISHRGFNVYLASTGPGIASTTTSAHNIILQAIIDGGFVGLILMLTLLYRIAKRSFSSKQAPIFFLVLSSMMVDYYLDHSLPWMLCAGWCLNIYRMQSSFVLPSREQK